MKVLVTGGAGFIGSHVVDLLIEDGHAVTILDNLSTGRRANLHPDATFIEMDIRSSEVHSLWEGERFEAMIHLAAQMDVRKSVENPAFDADNNILGLLNLMEAGRRYGLRRVVFSSSGGAGYDDSVPFPTPETVPPRPVSPYGIAKISSELYLNYYRHAYGVSYTALRLGNVYGPRQNPFGEAGVIAIFSRYLLEGKQPVINGDGRQTRDYVFCRDVARAMMLALNSDVNDSFNVGTSRETSVVELFDLINAASGARVERQFGPGKPGEVTRSCLSYSKIEEELGWKPQMPLEKGIAETVRFFERQLKDENAR